MARILIADDEQDLRDLLVFTLQFAGHEVIATKNGEEAVDRALQDHPDLVLLDIRMPRLTGYQACEKLKADPTTQNIPLVFLSAKGQDHEIQAGLDMGAADYIVKPFSPQQVLDRIHEILARQAV